MRPTLCSSPPAARCPRCSEHLKWRDVPAEDAARWYHAIKRFLCVVPSFGCYTPSRGKKASPGDHKAWPLHFWRGPSHAPLVLTWSPSTKWREPTFVEFCRAYGLRLEGE